VPKERLSPNPQDAMLLLSGSATGRITCCKLDSTLCIETSKELRTRLAEVVYEEHADQSLTKQLVTCSMDTAYPPIRNRNYPNIIFIQKEIMFLSYIITPGKINLDPKKIRAIIT
jgi:hypothetical protein